jgi:hypothetical protein
MKITVKNDQDAVEELDVVGVHPPPGQSACDGCGFSHGGATAETQCLRKHLKLERSRVAQLRSIVSRRKVEVE